jgi:hypothetical protein
MALRLGGGHRGRFVWPASGFFPDVTYLPNLWVDVIELVEASREELEW